MRIVSAELRHDDCCSFGAEWTDYGAIRRAVCLLTHFTSSAEHLACESVRPSAKTNEEFLLHNCTVLRDGRDSNSFSRSTTARKCSRLKRGLSRLSASANSDDTRRIATTAPPQWS